MDRDFAEFLDQYVGLREYVSLAQEYDLNMRWLINLPEPPEYYASIRGKVSGELLGYMFFDGTCDQWVMISPSDADAELIGLFD